MGSEMCIRDRAMAADIVILEAEEVVQPGKIEPDHVQLPGVFVDYVVLA